MTRKTKRTFKTYKTYTMAARNCTGSQAVVQVGPLYIVGDFSGLDEVTVINRDGYHTGTVTLRHLERLGNANHAWSEAGAKLNVPKVFYAELD